MDSPDFQQLLELEANLATAQCSLTSSSSTALLISHLESITSNRSSSQSSSLEQCTKAEIIELLNQHSAADLSLSCSACHQALFADDEMARDNKPKDSLQSCCLQTLNHKHSDLEISFWWFLINSFSSCILTLPNYTRFMLTSGGIPPQLRDRVWGVLTQACDSKGNVDDYMENLCNSLNNDISPDLRIILKDVNRTFPELSMFNEFQTKYKFERVLNAFSIYDSDMGYCQGLQFIVAPFLFHYLGQSGKDELKTFNSMVNFFDINKLRNIYDNDMSDLHLWFYKFEEIFKLELPELYQYFKDLNIDMNMFLSQWFLSFYSITIPFSFLIRMFDIMLFEGVEQTLLRVGLVILKKNSALLRNIEESELIYQHLLSENCWGVFSNNVDEFIGSILNLPVESFTNESLSSLAKQYEAKSDTSKSSKHSLKGDIFNVNLFNKLSFGNLKSSTDSIFSSSSSNSSNDYLKPQVQSPESTSSSIRSKSNSISSAIFSNYNNSSISVASTVPSVVSSDSSDKTMTKNSGSMESNESGESDLDLLKDLYNLCLENNLKSSLLDKVRDRLSSVV